jgi:hypothetical protein
MESKGGQEADHAARNQLGSESQAVVLEDGRLGEYVDSPSATVEQTAPFRSSPSSHRRDRWHLGRDSHV